MGRTVQVVSAGELGASGLGPLRDGWFDIVNWLEFALPARGPLPLDRAYFRVCINLLRHFFRLKKHLADLLERSAAAGGTLRVGDSHLMSEETESVSMLHLSDTDSE